MVLEEKKSIGRGAMKTCVENYFATTATSKTNKSGGDLHKRMISCFGH